MSRTFAMRMCWLLGVMMGVSPLAACDNLCTGCGTACPDLRKRFDVTLFATGTCLALSAITNTLAHLTVLRQDTVGSQTTLAVELSSLDAELDIGLNGTLCAPAASSKPLRFNASFLRRDDLAGPVILYALDGTFAVVQGQEPTVSATLNMTFSDPADASATCAKQVLVSSLF